MAQDGSVPAIRLDSEPGYTAFRTDTANKAHNEAAFRHFLAIERRRAGTSPRSVVLVLVSVRRSPGRNEFLTAPTASAIFAALGASVREVDFVGWFHDGRVAGAALIQRDLPRAVFLQEIAARITQTLRRELRDSSKVLRVRMIPLGTGFRSR